MRQWGAVGFTVGIAAILTACSSSAPKPGSPSFSPRSSARPTSAASALPTLAPPALNDFPDADTPIGSPDLPATLRGIWQAYDVTLVPGRAVVSNAPPLPTVRNATNGAVSDTDVQLWVAAEMRTNQYIQWMAANDQTQFNRHLRSDAFLAGPIGQALARGERVTLPACDLYAASVAVVVVDQSIRDLLARRGESTTATDALVMRYAGPCAVTGANGEVLLSIPPEGGVTVETGAIRHDPVLGDIWYSDAGAECRAGASPPLCQAAS